MRGKIFALVVIVMILALAGCVAPPVPPVEEPLDSPETPPIEEPVEELGPIACSDKPQNAECVCPDGTDKVQLPQQGELTVISYECQEPQVVEPEPTPVEEPVVEPEPVEEVLESTGPDHVIVVKEFEFDPKELTIKVGETIQWTNERTTVQNGMTILVRAATSKGIIGFKSPTFRNGETFEYTFEETGKLVYLDVIYVDSGVLGTITIEP